MSQSDDCREPGPALKLGLVRDSQGPPPEGAAIRVAAHVWVGAAVALGEPEAVILDVQMPEMDGWETLATLRSRGPSPGVAERSEPERVVHRELELVAARRALAGGR